MKKIFYVYRTPREKILKRVLQKKEPDHVLYGLNYFRSWGYEVSFTDLSYRRINLFHWIIYPIERILIVLSSLGFKLDQALIVSLLISKFDLIVATTDSAALPLLLLKKIGIINRPIIYISIGLANELESRKLKTIYNFYKSLLQHAEFIICHSPMEQKIYKSMSKDLAERIKYIPFGVDYDFFSMKRENGDFIFSVGHDRTRDYELLAEVARSIPDIEFILVTQKSSVQNIKFPDNVIIYFNLPYDKVKSYYTKARLVFLPLKEINRAGGQTSFLESIASGNKIVIGGIKGIREVYGNVIESNKNVYLYKPGRKEDAVNKIKKALKSRLFKCRFSKKYSSYAYARALEKFTKII